MEKINDKTCEHLHSCGTHNHTDPVAQRLNETHRTIIRKGCDDRLELWRDNKFVNYVDLIDRQEIIKIKEGL